jgi:hypothetical protein
MGNRFKDLANATGRFVGEFVTGEREGPGQIENMPRGGAVTTVGFTREVGTHQFACLNRMFDKGNWCHLCAPCNPAVAPRPRPACICVT